MIPFYLSNKKVSNSNMCWCWVHTRKSQRSRERHLNTTIINLNLTKICIINFGLVFLQSAKLKLEECLLCCGVVVVSCMGEMKLNLLNLVWMNLKYIWFYIYIYIIFLIILVFFLYKKSYLLFLIRWVPPWSRRIFCNQRDWEGDILTLLSCFSKLETLPVI